MRVFADSADAEACFDAPFQYLPDATPVVTDVTPSSSPASGGILLTLSGTNFLTAGPHLLCRVGTAAREALAVSDALATCLAPPGSIGVATIALGSDAAGFSDAPVPLEYVRDVRVTSVHPSSGPATGALRSQASTQTLHPELNSKP